MNYSYPKEILDYALTTLMAICNGSCRRLNERKMNIQANTYDDLESRFNSQLNKALDFWNVIHDPATHNMISKWIESELILNDPRPLVLKKLSDVQFVIPNLLQDYEQKCTEFRQKFFERQSKPMYAMEIEVYAFKKLLDENPAMANSLIDNIKYSIVEKIISDYSGKGGWINDTDSFRFRFELIHAKYVISALSFCRQKLQELKINGIIPHDLTILIGIGYGTEIDLISGLRMGSGVNDAREVIDSARIKGASRRWESIGKVRRSQVACFLSRRSFLLLKHILNGKYNSCKCEIRNKKRTIYELSSE